MSSYYKQINNVKYDRNVLAMAEELQQGQGDGRISKADAKKLSAAVYDGFNGNSVRTGTEDKTVARIYKTANFTPAGRDTFEHANRSAGAKNGWATRRANAAKAGQKQAMSAQQAPVQSQQFQAPVQSSVQSSIQSSVQSSVQSPIASQLAVRIAQQS